MMGRLCAITIAAAWAVALAAGCARGPAPRSDAIYQVSTISALLEGVYDGETTADDLLRRGDLGIGTFNALEGEMIVLDGKVYQARADGQVFAMPGETNTPFAVVSFFDVDEEVQLSDIGGMEDLKSALDQAFGRDNLFLAVRIDGAFDYVKARSVPRQAKPYPPLAQSVEDQRIFLFEETEGTILGFRCPDFVEGINVPGWHLHFLSSDRRDGGHLLDCRFAKARAQADISREFFMRLPDSEAFMEKNLGRDMREELDKVERDGAAER